MIKPEFLNINVLLNDSSLLKLFSVVRAYGGVLRFVGGAVRDAIAGIKRFEIDLATDLSPEELVDACSEEGIKTIPVGLKTATTGVILNNKIYQVSSLYKKHSSEVEFTDDWNADASKRDLTINAVYADDQGNVFDYYQGIDDLENGVIRFIGDGVERIKEHPIRIMRFFRFYALFGKGDPDLRSLKACISCKEMLRQLPIEQVRDELFKLFTAENLKPALQLIFDYEILSYILPVPEDVSGLENLAKAVARYKQQPDPLRRLFVLYHPNVELAENLAVRLHLSKNQKKRIINWAKYNLDPAQLENDGYLLGQIYVHGHEFCKDKLLFLLAENKISEEKYFDLINHLDLLPTPEFPLTGAILLEKGLVEKHKIGESLEILKTYWLENQLKPTAEELCAYIRKN